MADLYAMQRANGDWYALDDKGRDRMPIFVSGAAGMIARSRDPGMECFRPVLLNTGSLSGLVSTDGRQGCYWLVEDPERKLSRGRAIDHLELSKLVNLSRQKN